MTDFCTIPIDGSVPDLKLSSNVTISKSSEFHGSWSSSRLYVSSSACTAAHTWPKYLFSNESKLSTQNLSHCTPKPWSCSRNSCNSSSPRLAISKDVCSAIRSTRQNTCHPTYELVVHLRISSPGILSASSAGVSASWSQ